MSKTTGRPSRLDQRLTEAASADIADILRETTRRFGRLQRANYAHLIDRAIAVVAENPERPGSRPRDELGPGVRSFHVELVARRLGAAAHLLYYFRTLLEDGQEGVLVLRVLHESMDPTRRIPRELP